MVAVAAEEERILLTGVFRQGTSVFISRCYARPMVIRRCPRVPQSGVPRGNAAAALVSDVAMVEPQHGVQRHRDNLAKRRVRMLPPRFLRSTSASYFPANSCVVESSALPGLHALQPPIGRAALRTKR